MSLLLLLLLLKVRAIFCSLDYSGYRKFRDLLALLFFSYTPSTFVLVNVLSSSYYSSAIEYGYGTVRAEGDEGAGLITPRLSIRC